MPRSIRFHLDEHGSNAMDRELRRMGIDVTTTWEAGLAGSSDIQQLRHASLQGRVIFTQDDDYLTHHAGGMPHAGIAYCHQGRRSVGEIIRGLTLIWEIYEPEEMRNRVEYL